MQQLYCRCRHSRTRTADHFFIYGVLIIAGWFFIHGFHPPQAQSAPKDNAIWLTKFTRKDISGGHLFTFKFSAPPTVTPHNEVVPHSRFYVDFSNITSSEEVLDEPIGSPQVISIKKIYYPQAKVLRYIFYIPLGTQPTFQAARTGKNYTLKIISSGNSTSTRNEFSSDQTRNLKPLTVKKSTGSSSRKLLIIDPGHGGAPSSKVSSLGAESPSINGRVYYEKDLVLSIAKQLEALCRQTDNIDVLMLRTTDRYLSLDDRVRMAAESKGDLFLSIHLNATDGPKTARGFEIYYVSDTERDVNRYLTKLENDEHVQMDQKLSGNTNAHLGDLLREISQKDAREQKAKGYDLCVYINREFERYGPFKQYHRGIKSAYFRVLRNLSMPSALVECGFIDHPLEAKELIKPQVQQHIAALLFNGINKYFASVDGNFQQHSFSATQLATLEK